MSAGPKFMTSKRDDGAQGNTNGTSAEVNVIKRTCQECPLQITNKLICNTSIPTDGMQPMDNITNYQ